MADEKPTVNPDGQPRKRTRKDKRARFKQKIISLSPDLTLGMNDLTLPEFHSLWTDKVPGAVGIVEYQDKLVLAPASPGDPDTATLTYSSTGRTAYANVGFGIYPEEIPLLSQGTVHLKVEKIEWSPGKWGLAIDLSSAVLAREDESTPLSRRLRQRKSNDNSEGARASANRAAAGSMPDALPDPTIK